MNLAVAYLFKILTSKSFFLLFKDLKLNLQHYSDFSYVDITFIISYFNNENQGHYSPTPYSDSVLSNPDW